MIRKEQQRSIPSINSLKNVFQQLRLGTRGCGKDCFRATGADGEEKWRAIDVDCDRC